MSIPLDIFFWAMESAYVIHCLDEAFAGEGFVNMIKNISGQISTKKCSSGLIQCYTQLMQQV